MIRFVVSRLLQSLAALAILSVVVFALARTTGDPLHLILPMSATEEDFDTRTIIIAAAATVVFRWLDRSARRSGMIGQY